jgi:hypothetical protein
LFPKPDMYTDGFLIDPSHQVDLLIALQDIFLVDTYGVDPPERASHAACGF